jgi:hypothetical protein
VIDDILASAGAVADHLGSASLVLLAAAVLLHVARIVARARAWHNIVTTAYPASGLRYRHSLGAYFCGVGLSSVAPARPGELLKLAVVKRKAPDTRYEGLLSTLVTESAFDVVVGALAIGAAAGLGWASLGSSLVSPLGSAAHRWSALAAAVSGVAILLLAWRRLGPRARSTAREAARGLAAFGHPGRYLRSVVVWQLAALGLRLASIACFLAAFHLPATGQIALIVLAVQSAANVLPVTPNGAGTQQALLAVALGSRFAAPQVVGFGAGAQLATTVADVLLGAAALLLLTGTLRWRRVLPAAQEELPATT